MWNFICTIILSHICCFYFRCFFFTFVKCIRSTLHCRNVLHIHLLQNYFVYLIIEEFLPVWSCLWTCILLHPAWSSEGLLLWSSVDDTSWGTLLLLEDLAIVLPLDVGSGRLINCWKYLLITIFFRIRRHSLNLNGLVIPVNVVSMGRIFTSKVPRKAKLLNKMLHFLTTGIFP